MITGVKKRGRPRKEKPIELKSKTINAPEGFSEINERTLINQLFEEELKKTQQLDTEESEYYETDPMLAHTKRDGTWDVLDTDEIKYFDSELSYQLTGYRPINLTQGLDFDPNEFTKVSKTYLRTGKFTEYPKGSKYYNDFWKEQYSRCVDGYTVGKYRVTGDHYFFLNFYQMPVVNNDSTKAVTGQIEGFPNFLSKQYEFFHYIEMCEYIGKDCVMLKARGLGFSEILAALGTRPFITTRNYKTYYTAAAENQLRPVLEKCWKQLDWLSMNTNGGMKRLRQKINNILHKRASLVDGEGAEYGRMTDIAGIVADHPRKVRGNRVHRLVFEEGGSNANFITSWIQGNALVELGGRKIGIKVGGGTGGDEGPQLAGLAKVFNNPITYGVLPYKNFYTRDNKVQYTGFFLPAHEFALDPKFLDHRGVTNHFEFRKHYEAQRNLMSGQDLMTYCAEHCFTPDEALLRQGENMFDSVAISDRLTQLRVHKMGETPTPMALIYDKSNNQSNVIKAIPSPSSKILILEPPLIDSATQTTYKNLYVAGIDAIDMGTAASASDSDVSDFCIVIKKRMFGMDEPKYVAIYKDRPRDIRSAYEAAMKLLLWYNCKALLEYTKITIQTYFREKGKGHLFMSRPEFAISAKTSRNSRKKELIGLPATETVIKHGLELIAMYVNDYCYGIDFDEMLEQLLNYSYTEKRKFDIIAAMGMCEIADEELSGVTPTVINNISTQWRDIGYYIDEYGIKRRGVKPKSMNYMT